MNKDHNSFYRHRSLLIRAGLLRATLFAGLWWILTNGEPTSWVVGVPTITIATLTSLSISAPGSWRLSLSGAVRFLPFFLWYSLRGGIDVARRAFHPHRPLSPVVVY